MKRCNDDGRRVGLPRVLEYYSSSKLLEYFFAIRVLVTFYFRLQISISVCSFFGTRRRNVEFFWKLVASRFHLQLSLEIDLNIFMLVQGPLTFRQTWSQGHDMQGQGQGQGLGLQGQGQELDILGQEHDS